MHLTYPNSDHHIASASPNDSGEAGAPANEIEVTPAMIAAGVDAFNENYDPEDPEGENNIVLRVFSSMWRAGPPEF
jgi:hypothetical protein